MRQVSRTSSSARPSRRRRSEEHTSELQSPCNLVCRLLLEKKKFLARREHEAHVRGVNQFDAQPEPRGPQTRFDELIRRAICLCLRALPFVAVRAPYLREYVGEFHQAW